MSKDKHVQLAFFWATATFLLAIVSSVYAPQAQAAINQSFTYQGKLLNKATGAVITSRDASCIVAGDSNDTCDFKVSLYTAASGGTLVWQETKTSVEIDSDDGSFELTLNCSGTFSTCNQNGGPDFNTSALYIELKFAPAGSFSETFSPRKQLSAVPYAFNASTVDGVNVTTITATPEGSITGSVGDVALDTTNSSLYLKTSGSATNTGWTLVGSNSGTALAGLSDTTVTTPASGNILVYDGTDSWDNKDLSGDITIDNTGLATISSDALDFTELADGLTLDAATTVTITDTNKLTWTRVSSGLFQEFTDGTDTFGIYNRAGTPESSIAADIGSLALDTTSGNLYIKTTDTVNTGWVQFSTTFLTTSGITSNSSGVLATDDFVFGSSQLDDDDDATHDARMFFDKSKGAFRVGLVDDTLYWDDGSRGAWSFASGQNTTASDTGATAMGRSTTASGNTATALGYYTAASGNVSTALGSYTTASGNNSTALGYYTTAQPYTSVVLGRYNVISGSTSSWVDTDPLFVIGNGSSDSVTANALTVLKNGNIGIGETIPSALLDIVFASTSTTAASELGLEFNITDTGIVTTGTDTLTGLDFNVTRTGATGGAINTIGLDLDIVGDVAGAGTSIVTGLDVTVSGADTNYAAIFQGGNVGIGTSNPGYKLDVSGNVNISGILTGGSPLKLGYEGISFLNSSEASRFSLYQAEGFSYDVPSAFANSLIFQTNSISNADKMEVCFWDNENQLMLFCINEGGFQKATTIRRSFQIVGNTSVKENDENFTLCEGVNFVDCDTDLTGADLFVADDIEAIGSIYSQESIYAMDNVGIGTTTVLAKLNIEAATDTALSMTRSLAGQWMSFDDSTDTFGFYNRAGTPEANIAADMGSLSINTLSGKFYIKTTDTVNTGWTELGPGSSTPVTKTADYTITSSDTLIFADGSTNIVTITLPDASQSGNQGIPFIIKATNTTNQVKIDTTSSQTIDGSTDVILALNETVEVVSNGTNWSRIDKGESNLINSTQGSGFIAGCDLTKTAPDSANFNMTTECRFRMVEHGDGANVSVKEYVYSAQNNIATGLGVGEERWIAFYAPGGTPTIAFLDTALTAAEYRDYAIVGRVWMDNAGNVDGIQKYAVEAFGYPRLLTDWVDTFGASHNRSGNIYSVNGVNLKLDKSAGESFRLGAWTEDDVESPNIGTDAAQTPVGAYYYVKQGSSVQVIQSDIQVKWDNNGTLEDMSSNRWSIQRIYHWSKSNITAVAYGQNQYDSLQDAKDARDSEDYIYNPALGGSKLRAWLYIKEGITVLNDTDDAEIVTTPNIFFSSGSAGEGTAVYWAESGTNLSPTISGNDLLLNAGETLTMSDMAQGSVLFTGANGLFSQDNANLFWDDTNNNLGIGTATPDSIKLDVEGDIEVGTGTTGCIRDADNTIIAGTCSSDVRLKHNIASLDGSEILAGLTTLNPVSFEWNEDFEGGAGGIQFGLIAQEVQEVFPEMVHEGPDGYLRVAYDAGLTIRLLTGIKELDKKIEKQALVLTQLNSGLEVESGGSTDETYEMLMAIGADSEEQMLRLAKRIAILEVFNGISSTETVTNEEESQSNSLSLSQFTQLMADGDALQFTGGVEFLTDVVFHAPVTLSSDQVGTLTIPAGATKVKVTFSAPFVNAPVVSLTPAQSIRGYHSLEEVTEEGFVVSLLIAGDIDLKFNWTAFMVDGEGAKVEVVENDSVNMDALLTKFDELTNDSNTPESTPGATLEPEPSPPTSSESDEQAEPNSATEPEESLSQIRILDSGLGYVRVRQEPTVDSDEIGQVTSGETYIYSDVLDDWYYVEYQPAQADITGEYGWVSGVYITLL